LVEVDFAVVAVPGGHVPERVFHEEAIGLDVVALDLEA